jgi:hypothetical protein
MIYSLSTFSVDSFKLSLGHFCIEAKSSGSGVFHCERKPFQGNLGQDEQMDLH